MADEKIEVAATTPANPVVSVPGLDEATVSKVVSQADDLVIEIKKGLVEAKKDGKISIEEGWRIFQEAIASIVKMVATVCGDASGSSKKTVAMIAVNNIYDQVLAGLLKIPGIPTFMQPIIGGTIKGIFLKLGSGCVDAMVSTFRKFGIKI